MRYNKNILIIEDNIGDYRLIEEALNECRVSLDLTWLDSGDSAEEYIDDLVARKIRSPDLILLDLNLPGKSGRELLKIFKSHKVLRQIPVIVLTTSESEEDIFDCYTNHANCYIKKPTDYESFISMLDLMTRFWFEIVSLPENRSENGNGKS